MASKIEDYALIGDCQTAGLVGRDGSIDWLCFPRFDSGACFAALLGTPDHGRWRIAPTEPVRQVTRAYRNETLVLETTFETDSGSVTLIDCMPIRTDAPDVVRLVQGRRGTVRMRIELAIIQSLITLKALTYAPTGGMVAAPTTSLPEHIGGQRNWDYRYCWLRDATFTLTALMQCGYIEEANAWRQWLLRAVAGRGSELRIMYGLSGERRLPELTLPWLPGYEHSSPVRIGNAAHDQFQLDVFGEVLDCLHLGRHFGLNEDASEWRIERELIARLEDVWPEPDEGIWEVRGPKRHFTHSKLMACGVRSGGQGRRALWARRAGRSVAAARASAAPGDLARARSCSARSGWPTTMPSWAGAPTPGAPSSICCPSETMSACSPRSTIPSRSVTSETSPRRSPIWA